MFTILDFIWVDVVVVGLYFCVRIEWERGNELQKSSCVGLSFIEKLRQAKGMYTTLFFSGSAFWLFFF